MVRCLHILKKHKDSRRPSSWRQKEITCTKEEAIDMIKKIREEIMESDDKREKFEEIAKIESDCSRYLIILFKIVLLEVVI